MINSKCVHGTLHPEGGHVFVPKDPRDLNFSGVCPFHNDCVEGLCTNNSIRDRLNLLSVDDIPSLPDDHEVWDIVGGYYILCTPQILCNLSPMIYKSTFVLWTKDINASI